jgi:methionyl-tRNA formyltransferase
MRILFAGSPAIAVPSLEALAGLQDDGIELVGILTKPDTRRGRRGTLEPTEVSVAATRLSAQGVPIAQLKPEQLGNNPELETAVQALKADLLVSFAYGHIFSKTFLSRFPLGGINVHPSLLPKYRGATPIPSAILNQDTETGISIQILAEAMDAGDILIQERFPLDIRETTATLSETVAHRAAVLLCAALRDSPERRPQTGEPSYCPLLTRDQGRIDWPASASAIDAQIRAFTPWPLSWAMHGEQELYILEAQALERGSGEAAPGTVLGVDKEAGILVQTGDGIVGVTRLQYRARKALDWRAFLNGVRDFSRLG